MQYQYQRNKTPIIEHEGIEYIFFVSLRHWGALMAEVEGNTEEMAYCKWAWH
jgi:hypothetical protein